MSGAPRASPRNCIQIHHAGSGISFPQNVEMYSRLRENGFVASPTTPEERPQPGGAEAANQNSRWRGRVRAGCSLRLRLDAWLGISKMRILGIVALAGRGREPGYEGSADNRL